MKLFVTGTDTNVGKTIVSAIISKKYQLDYWKPIQTGADEGTDSDFLRKVIGKNRVHEEVYSFKLPLAPSIASNRLGKKIHLSKIIKTMPNTSLIIEGAGGVMVPLNRNYLMLDLMEKIYKKFNTKIIVVSSTHLGTINHTLLTLNALKHRGIINVGIIFVPKTTNQKRNSKYQKSSEIEKVINKFGSGLVIGEVPYLKYCSAQSIKKIAQRINFNINYLKRDN